MAAGGVISVKGFKAQWAHAVHRFHVNIWNFEVQIGKKAVEIFKESFDKKKFNSIGGWTWSPRKDKKSHPLLVETGTLKKSIKYTHLGSRGKPEGVKVFTDPNAFGSAKRHPGFCYAAVHNEGAPNHKWGIPALGGWAHGASMPARPFMGDSSYIRSEIRKLEPTVVFKGLPI